jgi:aspartate-semialdehyde dehydrogenase
MKIALVGATGMVGGVVLEVIKERKLYFDELYLVASENSVGKKINFLNKTYTIISLKQAVEIAPNIAIFSAGG